MKTGKPPHSMYFVGIVCPGELDKKVHQFKIWMLEHYGCKVALRSPAHITLVPPFWFDESGEDLLLQTLSSFHSDARELVVGLNDFSHFSKRVLFIQILYNNGLNIIKSATELHFRRSLGDIIKLDDRPFTPHITIANRDLKPSDFIKAWEHFSKKSFDDSFHTSHISLLKLGTEKWNVIAEKNWMLKYPEIKNDHP